MSKIELAKMSDLDGIQGEIDTLIEADILINEAITGINETLLDERALINTNTSGVAKNKGDITSINTELAQFKTVAKTGDYNDLTNKPLIPSKTSDLTNDSGFITADDIPPSTEVDLTVIEADIINLKNATKDLKSVASTAFYNDLVDKPTIPTKTSQLENDSGFITDLDVAEHHYGEGVPESSHGVDGDFHLDTSDGSYYQKTNGSWKLVMEFFQDGESGGSNNSIHVGLTEPSPSLGKEGDIYFDTHKGEFYEKIDNTIWVMHMEFALKKDIPEIPVKVSELENDAGYITESKGFNYHRGDGFDPPESFGEKGDIFYRNDTGEILEKTDLGWSTLVRYATHEALKQKTTESAYDIAVRHGFVGTEVEWLDSLKGKSAYEIAVDNGFVGTEEEWLDSLKQ